MESSNETARFGRCVSGGGKLISLILPLLLVLLVSHVSKDAVVMTGRGEEGDGGSMPVLVSVVQIKAASGVDDDASVPGRGGRSSLGFIALMS
jgi:hypothetical protein